MTFGTVRVRNIAVALAVSILLLLPVLVDAAWWSYDPEKGRYTVAYTPMIEFPGISGTTTFVGVMNSLYIICIIIGGLFAVVRLVLAGASYMMSDVITTKAQARGDILGSLVGLAIILSAVLILNTINPNLTNINVEPTSQMFAGIRNDGFEAVTNPDTPRYEVDSNGTLVISNWIALSDDARAEVIDECENVRGGKLVIQTIRASCIGAPTIEPVVNTVDTYQNVDNSYIDEDEWAPNSPEREAKEPEYIQYVLNLEAEVVTNGTSDIDDIWNAIQAEDPTLNDSEHQVIFVVRESGAVDRSIYTQQQQFCESSDRFNGTLVENVKLPDSETVSHACVVFR